MIQPEVRSQQTTRSRAAGDAGSRLGKKACSVVQTRVQATGCRFLGSGITEIQVAAPA